MSDRFKYLFICGCPRSGTTALWRVLANDPRLRLGVERYGNRFFRPGFIGPEHFETERYFDLQEGDTFYDDLEAFNPIYGKQKERPTSPIYVGDKIPLLFRYLPQLREGFPGAKVLIIYRNLFDVAASYKRRAENPGDKSWSRSKGVASAIDDWSKSVWAFNKESKAMDILPIDHEAFFTSDAPLEAVYRYLDLPLSDGMRKVHAGAVRRAAELDRNRERRLTSEEAQMILLKAPIGGYRAIIEKAAALSDGAPVKAS